jgi:hypothetical protein
MHWIAEMLVLYRLHRRLHGIPAIAGQLAVVVNCRGRYLRFVVRIFLFVSRWWSWVWLRSWRRRLWWRYRESARSKGLLRRRKLFGIRS